MLPQQFSRGMLFLLLLWFLGSQAAASEATPGQKSLFQIINSSKTCAVTKSKKDCSYQVEDYFKVSIASIGTDWTGIHFEKSNASMPIYASFGTRHGCVIINSPGVPEFVFISPKNGAVYMSWQECSSAR